MPYISELIEEYIVGGTIIRAGLLNTKSTCDGNSHFGWLFVVKDKFGKIHRIFAVDNPEFNIKPEEWNVNTFSPD